MKKSNKKKIFALAMCMAMSLMSFSSCGDKKTTEGESGAVGDSGVVGEGSETSSDSGAETADWSVDVPIENFAEPQVGDKIIEMDIKDYGTVKFVLFEEYAEKACENFVGLAEKGYYDGLTFHRVINDFMIQGGDPLGNGTGGESVWGGSFDGGTDPHVIHATGAVAYANSGATSTDGSQFYIVTGTPITDEDFANYELYGYNPTSESAKEVYKKTGGTPFLDGGYTVFGQVFEGLDIILKIQTVETDASDKPVEDVIMNSVKVSEYNGEDLKWYKSDYEDSGSSESSDNASDLEVAEDSEVSADESGSESGEVSGELENSENSENLEVSEESENSETPAEGGSDESVSVDEESGEEISDDSPISDVEFGGEEEFSVPVDSSDFEF